MKIRLLFALFTMFFLLHSVAQADIYRGTIGKNLKIVAELKKSDDPEVEYAGRYFYEKHKRDISLSGNLTHLKESSGVNASYDQNDEPKDHWKGEFKGDNFVGHWTNAAGTKTLSIRLKKIAESGKTVYSDERKMSQKRDAYERIKMERKLHYGKVIKRSDVSYRAVSDPLSKAEFIQIVDHPSNKLKEKFNAHLMGIFWGYVLDFDDCDSRPSASVNYISSRVLDITEGGSIYCGGAHPTNYMSPKTFDLSTGKELIWNDHIEGLKYDADWKGHYVGKALQQQIKLAVKEKNKSAEASDAEFIEECFEFFDDPHDISFHITKKGFITVALDGLPHAVTPCVGDYVDMPIEVFKLKKAGELLFD